MTLFIPSTEALVYTPTGKLNVKLGKGFNDYMERRWSDGASATLEQRIDEIVAGTIALQRLKSGNVKFKP